MRAHRQLQIHHTKGRNRLSPSPRQDRMFFLKKLAGVSGRHLGRYPVITISPKAPDHRLDLVQRNFRAQAPGKPWAAEITYVRTLPRCGYTAFAVDVFSRKIAGVTTR